MNRSPLTALLVATLLGMATAASAVNLENHQKSASAPLDFELADARGFVQGALPHTVILDASRRPCARLTGEVTAAWLAQTLAHCPSL